MAGLASSPAGHGDDDDSIDISVVVGDCTCPWTVMMPASRRASWQAARLHDPAATVRLTLPSSATTRDVIDRVLERSAGRDSPPVAANYELVVVQLDSVGRSVAERVLRLDDCVRLLGTRSPRATALDRRRLELRLCRRRRTGSCAAGLDNSLTSLHALQRPRDCPADLCDLPELSETSLLDSLRRRFDAGCIYTYVGAILVAVNPFRYYPIYNPKYVSMYQGCRGRRRADLPPHIFAVADAAYAALAQRRSDQCVVISGESGSGKTQTANLVLNHLSALSRRIFYSDAKVEESILSAGPVLEAFGNAKTVHNNNSSRFGKFVQVNYWQNGTVHGASIEKYLLEKSRIVQQTPNERNYHVFYYLLAGCSEAEKDALLLKQPQDYFYLNQNSCYHLDDVESDNESLGFVHLKHAMETVGFSSDIQHRIFIILSAILHLGNISFKTSAEPGCHNESVTVENTAELTTVSHLLKVMESTLVEAIVTRKTVVSGETVVMIYNKAEAASARDATAKCLYGALFDWIVLQINTTLLSKHGSRPHKASSIGVLDIFGFEDFTVNSFEQFCINYANETLHFYFNQHIFKFEQEEYRREGIRWTDIEFNDNTTCLELFNKKPTGLLYLLDEECNLKGATNETLLAKFNSHHQGNTCYKVPATKQSVFTIVHYAGKVKYLIKDFREKNSDLMQRDIIRLLKNSNFAFLHEIIGEDPMAVLRWSLVRVFFRACFAFVDAGRQHRRISAGNLDRYGGSVRRQAQRRPPFLSDSSVSSYSYSLHKQLSEELCAAQLTAGAVWPLKSVMSCELIDKENYCRANSSPGSLSDSSCSLTTMMSTTGANDTGTRPDRYSQKCNISEQSDSLQPSELSVVSATVHESQLRSKVYRPRLRAARLKTMQSLSIGMIGSKVSLGTRKSKSKPPSISSQFNSSLQRLMETLNQANPFFIRCIKSNADKAAGKFDVEVVQRQLRYTGMLATVQIRQAGYNYRLTFEDFILEYSLLLPRGRHSSHSDIAELLATLAVGEDGFQIGRTKVFLREYVKQCLDEELYCKLLQKVVVLQSWLRSQLQRRRYVLLRSAVVRLQCHIRGNVVRQKLTFVMCQQSACVTVQRAFRAYRQRRQQQLHAVALTQLDTDSHSAHNTNSAELRASAVTSCDADAVDAAAITHNTTSSDLQVGTTVDKTVPSVISSVSVMVRRTDHVAADSDVVSQTDAGERQFTVSTAVGPQISTAGDGSVRLTVSYLPSTVEAVSDDDHSVSRSADSDVMSTAAGLSVSDVHSSSASEPSASADSVTDNSLTLSAIDTLSTPSPVTSTVVHHDNSSTPVSSSTVPMTSALHMSRDLSPHSKLHKCQSAAQAGVQTQLGPSDIEIEVQRAAPDVSLHESSYQKTDVAFKEKPILAPLARMESFADNDDEQEQEWRNSGVIRRILIIDEEPPVRQPQAAAKPGDRTLNDSALSAASNRSPFQRVKKHVKQIMTAKDVGIVSPAESVGAANHYSRKQKHQWRSKTARQAAVTDQAAESVSGSQGPVAGSWSVSGTSQWQYPTDVIVHTASDLLQLQQFLVGKLANLHNDGKQTSASEAVFQRALKMTYESLVTSDRKGNTQYKYCDLMLRFEDMLDVCVRADHLDTTFPAVVCINAFRGFLDEFVKKLENKELPEVKVKKQSVKRKKKKRAKERTVSRCGHTFVQDQFNIYTVCEYCSSYIWVLEKAQVCNDCRLTVHKKCCVKVTNPCPHSSESELVQKSLQTVQESSSNADTVLSSMFHDSAHVLLIIERLINEIERTGLYTIGIYRKPGPAAKIKQLIKHINSSSDVSSISLSQYHVHVLTSVMKSFFREMKEPLMTFALYQDFIQAAEISDEKERIRTLYGLIARLPAANHDLLEQLVFHLTRVAQQEASNCMSVQGLSIIFAPSILRTTQQMSPMESLRDVTKQAVCLQCIIEWQMKKVQATLGNIMNLDSAAITVNDRLTALRTSHSLRLSAKSGDAAAVQHQQLSTVPQSSDDTDDVEIQSAELKRTEMKLIRQIESIQEEREALTVHMTSLECQTDDDVLSADELESTVGDMDEPTDTETESISDVPRSHQKSSSSIHSTLLESL